jgi:hypothetical protein
LANEAAILSPVLFHDKSNTPAVPLNVLIRLPSRTFHKLTRESNDPLAKYRPSGLNAMEYTAWLWYFDKSDTHFAVSGSHNLIV